MATTGGISSGSTGGATIYGTNVAPIAFPGIASGLDYNAIIDKYTQLTLAQQTPLKTQLSNLNAQQTELYKIQNLLNTFQDSFKAVSDPNVFGAATATASTAGIVGLSTIPGLTPTPGTTQINLVQLATATSVRNDPAANGTLNTATNLFNAGFAITPSNGAVTGQSSSGLLTVNGVQIAYDVNSDTLASLNTKLTNAGANAQFAYNSTTNRITLTSTAPSGILTVGSGSDRGNILSVFKLDTANITGASATSSGPVAGINLGATFNAQNNAGFATAVTAGSFTINGVKFTVDPTKQNLANVINAINQSSAGVVASYDAQNAQLVLTSKTTGAQSIAIGAAGDSSNFLQAVGILANAQNPSAGLAAGAQQKVGTAARVDYVDASGVTRTAYSQANDFTNVIPGVDIKLQQSTTTPFSITVAKDPSQAEAAIKTFTDAYNAVIDEINTATQAPVFATQTSQTTGQQQATQAAQGGVLFNNQDILSLRDKLVQLVSNLSPGSTSYNSFASVGLKLDNSFAVTTASSTSGDAKNQNQVTTQSFAGTSGKLAALDKTKFEAALAANPTAVQKLFVGTQSIIGSLGAYLTTATGLPTQLASGLAGSIPRQSLFSIYTSSNTDRTQSLQRQIQLITDQANKQADTLRAQFLAAETTISKLQATQASLAGSFASTKSS